MIFRCIVHLVVFISAVTLSQQSTPPPEQCDFDSPAIKSMKPSFGGIDGFYNIAKGISDGLQNTPNSKTYNDLNNLIFRGGAVTYDQVITDMVVNQIGAIIFWSVGFVFVLAALVLGIATCIWQCCYSCVPKETSIRSEITGYVYAFLLFTVFSFTLTGLILFNVAESNLIDSVDDGMVYTNQIYGDLNNVISNGGNQINCEVTETTTQTFTNMRTLIGGYSSNVVDGTQNEVGVTAVNNFDNVDFANKNQATEVAANALKASLANVHSNDQTCMSNKKTLEDQFQTVTVTLQSLTNIANEVRTSPDLIAINTQIDTIKNQIQEQADNASGSINTTQAQINDSMSSITNMLDNVQQTINSVINSLKSAHRDLVGSSAYSALKIGVRLVVTIPACIGCCFCILAFVAVVVSLRKQDGLAIKLSSAVLSAFYSTITISIILLLFSSLAFVLGWFTSAMCVPIFEDDNYQLFHLMNQTIAPVNGVGSPDVINIGNVLESCNDPSMTLYTAINGSTVISADSITSQLNLDQYRDQADDQIMQQQNLSFPMDPAWKQFITDLNTNTQAAKQAPLTSCGDNDAVDKYNAYIQTLDISNTKSEEFYNNMQTLSDQSPKTVWDYKSPNKVFMCRPLVDIYNNGGFVMCEQFGKPIQGLWAAIGLAGLFLFFLSILLLLTFRWLKTHSKETAGSGKDNLVSLRIDLSTSLSNFQYGTDGTRKLGDQKKSKSSEEFDFFGKPVISSTSNTGRRLPRVRPFDMDVVDPSEYGYQESTTASHMPRVQVLPDERHPNMSPNYYDTQEFGTRNTRFNDIDLFDYQSNNGSTQRGLRRM
ncbi:Protein CBG03046 [Caenorhabditis briggsae]|uniref:Protein CBG03046 n=1 Tax=Caenorhabditis briggsae TaxID=6238 RepID=A8WSX3_CAEBR|nr:Protein CBG03046 [Caenorhabditis briggsae]CAP23582.2 Protein CBG03046 [Caenorhabditis briggsae]